jgi:hypothetical protein
MAGTDEVVPLPEVLFAAMCIFGSNQKFRIATRIARWWLSAS